MAKERAVKETKNEAKVKKDSPRASTLERFYRYNWKIENRPLDYYKFCLYCKRKEYVFFKERDV